MLRGLSAKASSLHFESVCQVQANPGSRDEIRLQGLGTRGPCHKGCVCVCVSELGFLILGFLSPFI